MLDFYYSKRCASYFSIGEISKGKGNKMKAIGREKREMKEEWWMIVGWMSWWEFKRWGEIFIVGDDSLY